MRILVIEDEKKIHSALKVGLEAECFAVDIAEDGDRGSYLGRTNGYDLIILDNVLPKKSGMEVCKEIRESGKTTPILMLSVKSETTTKASLLNAGADDYMTKPYSLEELLARVRALLRRPKNIESETLQVGDLFLDIKRNIVRRKNKEIYLTRKEFALLEYLMKNRGIVLSRSMLMEHVWDMNADPFSNTIESHILSLRRKINSKGKDSLIHTIPARGYKLEVK